MGFCHIIMRLGVLEELALNGVSGLQVWRDEYEGKQGKPGAVVLKVGYFWIQCLWLCHFQPPAT